MFNPFRKKFKPAPVKSERKAAVKQPPEQPVEAAKSAAAERPAGKRRVIGVLIRPHLTEKSNAAGSRGWYAFRVAPGANKITIRRAVEDRYGIGVEKVRVLSVRPKKIRLGRIEGKSAGFRKAMVKLRQGQSIEFT